MKPILPFFVCGCFPLEYKQKVQWCWIILSNHFFASFSFSDNSVKGGKQAKNRLRNIQMNIHLFIHIDHNIFRFSQHDESMIQMNILFQFSDLFMSFIFILTTRVEIVFFLTTVDIEIWSHIWHFLWNKESKVFLGKFQAEFKLLRVAILSTDSLLNVQFRVSSLGLRRFESLQNKLSTLFAIKLK